MQLGAVCPRGRERPGQADAVACGHGDRIRRRGGQQADDGPRDQRDDEQEFEHAVFSLQ